MNHTEGQPSQGKFNSLLYPDYLKTAVPADGEKVARSSVICHLKFLVKCMSRVHLVSCRCGFIIHKPLILFRIALTCWHQLPLVPKTLTATFECKFGPLRDEPQIISTLGVKKGPSVYRLGVILATMKKVQKKQKCFVVCK